MLFAGRAGTALASEIGLMKATDQLSAMEMMAVNPVRSVVVPRFLGACIAMPLLTAIFCAIGLFGAHLVGVSLLGVDVGAFWQQMQQTISLKDVEEGIVKSILFGGSASLIATKPLRRSGADLRIWLPRPLNSTGCFSCKRTVGVVSSVPIRKLRQIL